MSSVNTSGLKAVRGEPTAAEDHAPVVSARAGSTGQLSHRSGSGTHRGLSNASPKPRSDIASTGPSTSFRLEGVDSSTFLVNSSDRPASTGMDGDAAVRHSGSDSGGPDRTESDDQDHEVGAGMDEDEFADMYMPPRQDELQTLEDLANFKFPTEDGYLPPLDSSLGVVDHTTSRFRSPVPKQPTRLTYHTSSGQYYEVQLSATATAAATAAADEGAAASRPDSSLSFSPYVDRVAILRSSSAAAGAGTASASSMLGSHQKRQAAAAQLGHERSAGKVSPSLLDVDGGGRLSPGRSGKFSPVQSKDREPDDGQRQGQEHEHELTQEQEARRLAGTAIDGDECDGAEDEYDDEKGETGSSAFMKKARETGMMFPTHSIASKLGEKVLRLPMNGLGDRGVVCLSAALAVNTCIQFLDLRDNNIGRQGVQHLFEALGRSGSASAVRALDLSENPLLGSDPACIRYLEEMLRNNSNLVDLKLRACRFGDRYAAELTQALGDAVSIRNLDLSQNLLTEQSAHIFSKFIGQNIYMKKIDLSWNRFRDSGCNVLLESLKSNSVLAELNLAWNGLGDGSASVLCEILSSSDSLHVLDLRSNRITAAGAVALAKGLADNAALTVLRLSENPLSDSGCVAILHAVCKHSKLTELELQHCGGGAEAEIALKETQTENSVLQKLLYSVERVWLPAPATVGGQAPEP